MANDTTGDGRTKTRPSANGKAHVDVDPAADDAASNGKARNGKARVEPPEKESPLTGDALEEAITATIDLADDDIAFALAVKDIADRAGVPKPAIHKAIKKRMEAAARAAAQAAAENEPPAPTVLRVDVNAELAAMNRKLAVLREPVGTILVEGGSTGFQIATTHELAVMYANKPDPPEGGWVPAWLAYADRREFKRIIFAPGADVDDGNYNLWRGWAVRPSRKALDISLFWDFVRETICAGDEARYRYIRRWLAHGIQKPGVMAGVALLMHSDEGAGKDMTMKWVSPIYGPHFFTATSLDNVLGHFNVHLANALFVYANEAIWGGDKRQQGRMKALITDPTSDITAKGKDTITLPNFKRWIFASNADHPVPVDRTDRRFVVFEVAPDRIGDTKFFTELEALRTHGGVQALMRDLLAEDISDFNPAARPPGSGLAVYKHQSGSPQDKWLHGTLARGEIRRHDQRHDCYEPWKGAVLKNLIYDSYCAAAKVARDGAESESLFWLKLRKIGVVGRDKRLGTTGARPRAVTLRDLNAARSAFAKYMNETTQSLWDSEELADLPGPCSVCEKADEDEAAQPSSMRRRWN